MPYTLHRSYPGDGALIQLGSHYSYRLNAGDKFDDEDEFPVPVRFEIDVTSSGRRMPSFFDTPAFVARKSFHEALLSGGVDNIDPYPAEILNPDTGEEFPDYLFLNVIGAAECADLAASDHEELGPGINMINELVLIGSKIPDSKIFRLADDITKIVVSDDLREHLQSLGLNDVYFAQARVR